ncbi:MAG: DUF6701 domain-containing protein [Gammaproteobacteria bacterium]|nr:DUF6701 domain-containing protein [Gammaproteobacteria bacterium]
MSSSPAHRTEFVAATWAVLLLLVVGLLVLPAAARAECTNCTTTDVGGDTIHTFNPGSGTFTAPDGVTEVTVEAWGGGGGGSSNSGFNSGGGGGGGAYASRTFTVTPGNTYPVTMGTGGGAGNNGGDSSFVADAPADNVVADGGSSSGNSANGGTGGQAGASQGDVTRSGGNGGNGTTTGFPFDRDGGGGGGSATAGADGGNGADGSGGGAGGGGEGDGGDGGDFGDNGNAGEAPGGGGGGRGGAFGTTTSGAGADGRLTVRFTPPAFECPGGTSLQSGIEGQYFNWTGSAPPPRPSGTPDGTRIDGPIDFDWGGGSPGVAGIGDDEFSVLWDGYLRATSSGNYQFQTVSDDGVRLWVNDTLVIDNWTDHASTTDTSGNVFLSANQVVTIRLEYYENGGQAEIRLRWGPSGGPYTAIPAGPTPTLGEGLYRCPPPPLPDSEAQYHMDETSWDGSTDEVQDSSGNDRHGTAQGGATTDDATPAIDGDPGTCGYGTFDGNNDYVDVGGLSDMLNGTASLGFWIRTTQNGNNTGWQAPGVAGVEEAGGADDIFWGWLDASGNIGISVGNDYNNDQKSATEINDGDWHHVVLTRDAGSGDTKIYVDGVLETSGSTGSGVIGNTYSSIGRIEDTGGSPEYFEGDLDEVHIFNQVLTDDEVVVLRDSTHPCALAVSHFVISHDGTGINCLAEPVTVSARDSGNNVLTDYEGTITIDTQSGRGNWALAAGGGAFNDGTADDGLASYTFVTGDNGEATFNLDYREGPSPINILVTDGGITDDDSEGPLAFGPSGFTVTANALPNPPPGTINDPIQTQVAGTDFALHIAAFGQTPTDPECGIIEEYTGNKPLKFWHEYNDPGSGTIVPTIDGNAIAATEAGAGDQSVTFTDGQAAVAAKYKDVGRIRIHMKDDSVVEPVAGIVGASSLFVVQPADFTLSDIERTSDSFANPGAGDANGPVFIAAGADFSVTVTARDAEGDPTPNYGQESTAEDVRLDSDLEAPAGGSNPAIATGAGFAAFSSGEATGTEFSWPEVGIIQLTPAVADADYLGTGDVTGTQSGNIGRFIPFDFDVARNTPEFASACNGGSNDFTYIGQAFDYDTAPVLTVTATSRNQASTTTNYTGAFFKLTDAKLASDGNKTYSAASGTLDTALVPSPDPVIQDNGDGTATLTFDVGTGIAFERDAPEVPFDAEISLSLNVIDEDDVIYGDGLGGNLNPVRFGQASAGNGIAFVDDKEQRWGRVRLENTSGSELMPLVMPVEAEYYTADNVFRRNEDDDNCDSIVLADFSFSGPLDGVSTPPAYSAISSGLGSLTFPAPGEGNTGYVDATVTLSSFLQFDWDGDGSDDDNPAARATFGIYSGNPGLIYIREPW